MSARKRSCPAVIPADPRFAGLPLALVLDIRAATTFALAGILQFVPRFRRLHPAWHRRAGRVVARSRPARRRLALSTAGALP